MTYLDNDQIDVGTSHLPVPETQDVPVFEDADPILKALVTFSQAVLNFDIEKRWKVEAAQAGISDAEASAFIRSTYHVDMEPYLASAQVKLPSLSITRGGGEFKKSTQVIRSITSNFTAIITLPAMDLAQANKLHPLLYKAVESLGYRLQRGYATTAAPNSYIIDERIENLEMGQFQLGNIPGLKTNQYFPCAILTFKVAVQFTPDTTDFPPLEVIGSTIDDDQVTIIEAEEQELNTTWVPRTF